MCVSYRKLTAVTLAFEFPIARCDDAMDDFGDGFGVFGSSVLMLAKATTRFESSLPTTTAQPNPSLISSRTDSSSQPPGPPLVHQSLSFPLPFLPMVQSLHQTVPFSRF
jgi:hypothetical protein